MLRRIVDAVLHWRQSVATAIYVLRTFGFKALLRAIRDVLSGTSSAGTIPDTQRPMPSFTLVSPPVIDEGTSIPSSTAGISVIIPVLNGADDLVKLLPSLRQQQGFSFLEIIVVDSGSSDDSIHLAKSFGATVIQIEPKMFTHSYARNVGAERAKGDYLLFTVQDALPPSPVWLHQMHSFLQRENLSAVSCKEKPRIDADLFSRVENWYHYNNILQIQDGDAVLSKPSQTTPQTLRASAQLSNVACLIPNDVFQRYKFRGEYAEDLDLGLRLINDGAKLGLMTSTSVIHSHTRSSYDYLRRGFIDKLTIAQILNEPLEVVHPDFEKFVHDIFFTLTILAHSSLTNDKELAGAYSVDELEQMMIDRLTRLRMNPPSSTTTNHKLEFLDSETTKFLERVQTTYLRKQTEAVSDGNLLKGIIAFLEITFDYLRTAYHVLDGATIREIQKLQQQYFANLIGRYLAVWSLQYASQSNRELAPIESELRYHRDTWEEARQ